jgi:cellulose biosynthesis protein BcsQ
MKIVEVNVSKKKVKVVLRSKFFLVKVLIIILYYFLLLFFGDFMKIAVFSHKGGTGKSTITSHIAFRAMERDIKLTVVDTDRQRNTMSWLSKHENTSEPYEVGCIRVTQDPAELETEGLVVVDCPPSWDVISELKDIIDLWLVPVDGRFSVDGALNALSELTKERAVIVVNKAYDSKFGVAELKQIKAIPSEIFRFPIPIHDIVRKAEMLGVASWQVPYGIRSTTAQNLQYMADWVLNGGKESGTFSKSDKDELKIVKKRGVYA